MQAGVSQYPATRRSHLSEHRFHEIPHIGTTARARLNDRAHGAHRPHTQRRVSIPMQTFGTSFASPHSGTYASFRTSQSHPLPARRSERTHTWETPTSSPLRRTTQHCGRSPHPSNSSRRPPPRVQPIPLPHHPYRHPLDRLEPVGTRSTARTGRPRLGTRHRAPLHRPSHASPPLPRQTRSRIGQRNPRLWKHPTWNNPPLLTPQ